MKMLVNGMFGTGKSRFAATFPKAGWIVTEPQDLSVLREPGNEHLLANLVEYELCYVDGSATKVNWRQLVEEPTLTCPLPPLEGQTAEGGLIYTALKPMFVGAREGRIETLVLDNLTYTAAAFMQYLEKYRAQEPTFVGDSGKLDKRKMYGYLSAWLYRFLMTRVLNFPGNVVVTCHLKSESKEKMDKKKSNSDVEVVPNIEGGFRDKAEGLFGASIYLDRQVKPVKGEDGAIKQVTRFRAYTQNCTAFDSKILAKNTYGLPPVMQDISYQSIVAHMAKAASQQAVKASEVAK